MITVDMDAEEWLATRHAVSWSPAELLGDPHAVLDFVGEFVRAQRAWLDGGDQAPLRVLRPRLTARLVDTPDEPAELLRRIVAHDHAQLPLVDLYVTTCCNLRCAGCVSAAALARPWFAEIDQLDRTLVRLAELSGDDPPRKVNLMGGEPTLHPHLAAIAQVVRRRLPGTGLTVFTNGSTVSGWSVDWLRTLGAVDCGLQMSLYTPWTSFNDLAFTGAGRDCAACVSRHAVFVPAVGQLDVCDARPLLPDGRLMYCSSAFTAWALGDAGYPAPMLAEGVSGDVLDLWTVSTDDLGRFLRKPRCPLSDACAEAWPTKPWRPDSSGLTDWVRVERGCRRGQCTELAVGQAQPAVPR